MTIRDRGKGKTLPTPALGYLKRMAEAAERTAIAAEQTAENTWNTAEILQWQRDRELGR